MTIISDLSIEQLNRACDKLKRASEEYDARIAEAGASHFSTTAAAIRRELKMDLLRAELDSCLARVGHVDQRRTDDGRRH
jgi:hypothetical protein